MSTKMAGWLCSASIIALILILTINAPMPDVPKEPLTMPEEFETWFEVETVSIPVRTTEAETTTEETTTEELTTEAETFKAIEGIALSAELQEDISNLCEKHEIDFIFFIGWMFTESSCRWVIGDNNDTGYMQIIPYWHYEAAMEQGIDIYTELGNCEYALILLNDYLNQNGGDMNKALQQYNTGDPNSNNGYCFRVYENIEYIRSLYEN